MQHALTAQNETLRSEVYSISLSGLVATLVTITVTIAPGPAAFELIGVAESCARNMTGMVEHALGRAGVWLDDRRVEVRVSPVDRHDDGMQLAIVTAVLSAMKQKSLPRTVVLGDIWPSGALRAVRGVLPALLGVDGMLEAIVPWNNGPEAACLDDLDVRVAAYLDDIIDYLDGTRDLKLARTCPKPRRIDSSDMADITGLLAGLRAVEIAAAGLHPLVFVGSPGSGKTMLSSRLPTVLPEMTRPEALEVTSIHSVAGHLEEGDQGPFIDRPFRMPHPQSGKKNLIGASARPGEVSLAHLGVLFLDMIQTVPPQVLSALDRVLEAGQVVLSRGQESVTFPACPLLVAGTFPCPCGFNGVEDRECKCSSEQVRAYRQRQCGPVFDRLDIRAGMSGYTTRGPRSESSAMMRARVVKAREPQRHRFERGEASEPVNGRLTVTDLERVTAPDRGGRRALSQAGLSPVLESKVLRVARTIADLDGSDAVRAPHVAEAIQLAPRPET